MGFKSDFIKLSERRQYVGKLTHRISETYWSKHFKIKNWAEVRQKVTSYSYWNKPTPFWSYCDRIPSSSNSSNTSEIVRFESSNNKNNQYKKNNQHQYNSKISIAFYSIINEFLQWLCRLIFINLHNHCNAEI